MTGFLRILASGALLLAATTTPSTLATTSDIATTDSTDDSCVGVIEGCQADDDCLSCVDSESSSSADEDACTDAWIDEVDPQNVSEAICAGLVGGLCCSAKGSDIDCRENKAFMQWVACSAGDCAEDDTVCDAILDGAATAVSDGATSTAGAAAPATLGVGGASTALLAFSCAFVVVFSLQ